MRPGVGAWRLGIGRAEVTALFYTALLSMPYLRRYARTWWRSMPLWRAISLTLPLHAPREAREVVALERRDRRPLRLAEARSPGSPDDAADRRASSRASVSTSSMAPGVVGERRGDATRRSRARARCPASRATPMRCSIHASTVGTCSRPARRAGRRPRRAAGGRRGARAAAGSSTRTCAMRKKRSLRKRPAFISAPRSRRVAASDAHVDGLERVAADALHLLLAERAQQLRLQLERQLAELVEEERAAVGLGERALAALGRAGERALLVAEEDALGERRRDAAAVDDDERRRPCGRSRRGWPWRRAPCPCPSRRG